MNIQAILVERFSTALAKLDAADAAVPVVKVPVQNLVNISLMARWD